MSRSTGYSILGLLRHKYLLCLSSCFPEAGLVTAFVTREALRLTRSPQVEARGPEVGSLRAVDSKSMPGLTGVTRQSLASRRRIRSYVQARITARDVAVSCMTLTTFVGRARPITRRATRSAVTGGREPVYCARDLARSRSGLRGPPRPSGRLWRTSQTTAAGAAPPSDRGTPGPASRRPGGAPAPRPRGHTA